MQIRIVMLFSVIMLYNCRSTTTEVAIVELTHEQQITEHEEKDRKSIMIVYVVYGDLGDADIKERVIKHSCELKDQYFEVYDHINFLYFKESKITNHHHLTVFKDDILTYSMKHDYLYDIRIMQRQKGKNHFCIDKMKNGYTDKSEKVACQDGREWIVE